MPDYWNTGRIVALSTGHHDWVASDQLHCTIFTSRLNFSLQFLFSACRSFYLIPNSLASFLFAPSDLQLQCMLSA